MLTIYEQFVSLVTLTTLPLVRLYRLLDICRYYYRVYSGNPLQGIFHYFCGMSTLLKDKPYWKFYIGSKPVVLLHKPESAEALLTNPNLIEKSFEYSFLKPWLRNGLITSSGSRWKSHRKMITPSFHFRILEDFVPVFNEQSLVMVNKLNETNGTKVDILHYMSLCSLDIICETAMGWQLGAQIGREIDYVKALRTTQHLINERMFRPWLWSDLIFSITSQGKQLKDSLETMNIFTRKVILERRAEFKKLLIEGKCPTNPEEEFITRRRRAFLDMLLYYHLVEGSMGLDEVKEEVDNFMFTGHDSAALTTSWVMYFLGLHQDVQKKVMEEFEEIFGDDYERPVTMEDTKKMKYLESVMKESLRIYTGIPYIARHLTEDLKIGKYTIPAGATVMAFTYMIHHSPDLYPNPEVFDPDRFLPENVNKRHPFAYLPFSAGPRNCVGQKFAFVEQKITLANILRNFQITSLIQRDKLQIVPELVLTAKPGLFMKFERRHSIKDINNNCIIPVSN